MNRLEYVAYLTQAYDKTAPNGGNEAIRRHRDKVTSMDDAQYQAHRAGQEALAKRAAPTIARLARSMVR